MKIPKERTDIELVEVLDATEVCKRLKIHRKTLTRLVEENAIGHRRFGAGILFTNLNVNEYLQGLKKKKRKI